MHIHDSHSLDLSLGIQSAKMAIPKSLSKCHSGQAQLFLMRSPDNEYPCGFPNSSLRRTPQGGFLRGTFIHAVFRIPCSGERLSMRFSEESCSCRTSEPDRSLFDPSHELGKPAINQSGSCSVALFTAQRLGEAHLVACQAALMGGEMG